MLMLKQCLNVATVGLSGFAKLPQIQNGARLKTTEGLSFLNLLIELTCWSMSASYFVFHGYAYTDFLEYPLLITQQLILVSMHLKFNRIIVSPIAILAMILAYFIGLYYMTLGPQWFLQILISINPPISAVGKLSQIYEIYKTSRGDLVSKLPFLTNAFTSTARLITIWMETQDLNLYISFGSSVVLNLGVVWSALVFTPKKEDKSD